MTISLQSLRVSMWGSRIVLAFVLFFCLYLLFWATGMEQRFRSDQKVLQRLSVVEHDVSILHRAIHGIAMSAGTSRRIYENIESIAPQAVIHEPVLMGAYRLHSAELSVTSDAPRAAENILEQIQLLQTLPIRLGSVDVSVGAGNRLSAMFLLHWVESL